PAHHHVVDQLPLEAPASYRIWWKANSTLSTHAMPLESLSQFDSATANAILTAAALSTSPDPGIGLIEEFSGYQHEVANVLNEVRKKLKLREGDQSARALIDQFLSDAFDATIFQGSAADAALSRAGAAGNLSPGAYAVVQPEAFAKQFYRLAVTKSR